MQLCGVWNRNSKILFKVPTEPNFLFLFLNFVVKAKSKKNLAVNGFATHERLEPLSVLHIGAVSHWDLVI